jgi:branched-chain amino acid transport system ATP-binding protein
MLSVTDLDVFYGRAQALFQVGFQVPGGQIVALLGRNGAGKSTTLKSIMGLVPPAAGQIVLNGREVGGLRPHALCAQGLGYVPEDRRIFRSLTVKENLTVGRRPPHRHGSQWTLDKVFALFPHLAALRDRRGGQISGGEQQMLTIARSLMGNPLMLLLDEPSTGLAPRITEHLARAVLDLKAAGLAVLLSEQNLRFAAAVADQAVVMETGHVRWRGLMAEFLSDPAASRAYLHV